MKKTGLLFLIIFFLSHSQSISGFENHCVCDKSNPMSCFEKADNLIRSMPKCYQFKPKYKENTNRVSCLLKKACDKNIGIACAHLASHMWGCEDMNATPEMIELYKKSCDLNYAKGCAIYAGFLDDKKDREKKWNMLWKACQSKAGLGCRGLVWMLEKNRDDFGLNGSGLIISDSDSLKKDSIKYLEQGCKYGDYFSCGSLGNHFQKRDSEKALSFFKMACNGNLGEACRSAALIEEEDGLYDKAINLLEKAKPLVDEMYDGINSEFIEMEIARVKERKKDPVAYSRRQERKKEQERLRIYKNSPEYKLKMVEGELDKICKNHCSIKLLYWTIKKEKEAGKRFGYLNQKVIYDSGKAIMYLESEIKKQKKEYKETFGKWPDLAKCKCRESPY